MAHGPAAGDGIQGQAGGDRLIRGTNAIPGPLAHFAHPRPASELRAFPGESREDIVCERRRGEARWTFVVCVILQPEDAHPFSIVAPDFLYAEPRVNRKFVQGRAGDVYLCHQLRGWIDGEIEPFLSADECPVLEVEALRSTGRARNRAPNPRA